MKIAICLSLLVGLVAVYAQKEQVPVCQYGKRTVSDCDGGEFTITIEGKDCQTKVKRTGKCMEDSVGNMVPVTSVIKTIECFYTLPDMSGTCDTETKKLAISQTLVSGNVDECKKTIETTAQCSENDDGELVPKLAEMKNPKRPSGGKVSDSEASDDAIPTRFEGGKRRKKNNAMRGGRKARSAGDGGEGKGPKARRPSPDNENGGERREDGGKERGAKRPPTGNEDGDEGNGDGGKGGGPGARRPGEGNSGEGRRRGARRP